MKLSGHRRTAVPVVFFLNNSLFPLFYIKLTLYNTQWHSKQSKQHKSWVACSPKAAVKALVALPVL
jgi:hypothetical protein